MGAERTNSWGNYGEYILPKSWKKGM